MRCFLTALALGIFTPFATLYSQTSSIPLVVDSLDGTQRDMAGPKDSTLTFPGDLTAFNARVVLAQGRRMIHHQVETRERMFSEEDPTFATPLAAVELDENLKLLFALAEDLGTHEPAPLPATGQIVKPGELRVYDDTIASAPVQIYTLTAPPLPGFTDPEPIRAEDIRVIPEDSRLLLLHNVAASFAESQKTRLTIYRYGFDSFGAFFLTEEGHVDLEEQTPPLAAPDCAYDSTPRTIRGLQRIAVQVDETPFTRRAFLLASLEQPRAVTSKGAMAILAVNLAFWDVTDPLNPFANYSSPAFYSGPNQIFDDYPCHPNGPSELVTEWAPNDLALIEDGANWFLAAVGGEQFQAKVFRVTSFDTTGFQYYTEQDFLFGPPPGVTTELKAVEASGTLLTILGRHHQIAVDIHDLPHPNSENEVFGDGPSRDTLLMAEGPASAPTTKLWSVTGGAGNPHRFKIMDFLSDPDPNTTERRYSPGGTDAAVFIPEYDSVYATSFSGVVRYGVSNGAEPDYSAYSAATPNPLNPQVFDSIEHMVSAKRTTPLDEWNLFGSTAQGGFFQWRIDPLSKAPEVVGEFDGNSWTVSEASQTYGQYVEYGINPLNGHEIVVVDYYNNTAGEIEVAAYDLTSPGWGVPVRVTNALDGIAAPVGELHLSEGWVFVGARKGFFAAQLDASNGLTLVNKASTWDAPAYPIGPVGGFSFLTVAGISRIKRLEGFMDEGGSVLDRLVVSFDDNDAFDGVGKVNRFAIAMYAFDPATGWIGNDSVTPAVAGEPIQVFFDGAGSQPSDDFPDIWIRGASKLRSYSWNNGTDVFCGTWNGTVLQLQYTQHSDTLWTTSYQWNDGGFYDEISDCSIVNIAASPEDVPILRITTPQWLETFAVLAPIWQPN